MPQCLSRRDWTQRRVFRVAGAWRVKLVARSDGIQGRNSTFQPGFKMLAEVTILSFPSSGWNTAGERRFQAAAERAEAEVW